jgi:hypothetical protein
MTQPRLGRILFADPSPAPAMHALVTAWTNVFGERHDMAAVAGPLPIHKPARASRREKGQGKEHVEVVRVKQGSPGVHVPLWVGENV